MRLLSLSSLALFLALAACSGNRRGNGEPDPEENTCQKPCGDACCLANEACDEANALCVACEPKSCETLGASCGSQDDGCGGRIECGGCAAGETCGADGQCGAGVCTPKTCQQLGAQCGSTSNGCGGILQCGTCATGRCGGGGVNKCGDGACTPESDREFCSRLGKTCGPIEDFDNCDNVRSVSICGNCQSPNTCGGGGADGVCGCTAESNAELCSKNGRTCGPFTTTDKCGRARTVQCGACEAGFQCGGDGTCECVTPTKAEFCADLSMNCGDIRASDRCGAQRTENCGSCTAPSTCGSNHRCSCEESDGAFCQRLGKNCGTVSGRDICNNQRSANCGSCEGGDACQANVCACVESEAQICTRLAYTCGTWKTTDRCGAPRTVTCGTCSSGVCGGKGIAGKCGANVVETAGQNPLYAVWAPDPTAAGVTSSYGYGFAFGDQSSAYRFSTSWSSLSGLNPAAWYDVDGQPGGNALAVGYGGALAYYNGSYWDPRGNGDFSTVPTQTFASVAHNPSSGNYYVLDSTGRLYEYASRRRCDGTSGSTDNLCAEVSATAAVQSIAVTNGGYTVYAAGEGGIFQQSGGSWSLQHAGGWSSIWASDTDDVWAVGPAGMVAHFDGTSWTDIDTGLGSALYEVSGTGPSDVWVSGDAGTVGHFDGKVWVDIQANTTAKLYGLSANTKRVIAVGASGTVVRVER